MLEKKRVTKNYRWASTSPFLLLDSLLCNCKIKRKEKDRSKDKVPIARHHTEQRLKLLPHLNTSIQNEKLMGLFFSFREYGTGSKTHTFTTVAVPHSTPSPPPPQLPPNHPPPKRKGRRSRASCRERLIHAGGIKRCKNTCYIWWLLCASHEKLLWASRG